MLSARSLRFARFRATAFPTLRLAVNPTRASSFVFLPSWDGFPGGVGQACKTRPGWPALLRFRVSRTKSARVLSRVRVRSPLVTTSGGARNAARLSGKLRAALGAAVRQDAATGLGGHAGAEAVAALAD